MPDSIDFLAYEITIQPQPFNGIWRVIVSAEEGEILEAIDVANYDNGTAKIFRPDPLSSARRAYGVAGFIDNHDANNSDLEAQLRDVVLLDIENNGGVYKLKGPYAEIVDSDFPYKGLFTQASSAFVFNRYDDAFEAVMCYYYIDMSMRYVNNTLGISVTPYQYSGGVRFDPSGANQSATAFYQQISGDLIFGESGNGSPWDDVDMAEDADVILHELGHGIHDWLTFGGLSNVEGLSEGFGDYWAQSFSRSLKQWSLDDPAYHRYSNWAPHNPPRTTNYSSQYPNTGLSIHAYGQVFSTTLMKIYDDIGRFKTDKIVLIGLSQTISTSNQNQAALMIYKAAKDLSYSDNDLCIIWKNFTDKGYTLTNEGPEPTSNVLDIYMQDSPEDFGIEINPDDGALCYSEDIWVRRYDDDKFTHQNPVYNTQSPNWIYVRIRGNSCSPVTDASLSVFWTKASTGLVWPRNWIEYYQTTHAGLILHGNQVNDVGVTIPSLEPGEEWIAKIPWYPPNPANFDRDQHHFCLLARIISQTDDPMYITESTGVFVRKNVKNNNNIVWKNIDIYNANYSDPPHSVFIENDGCDTKTFGLGVRTAYLPDNPNFFEMGILQITLDSALFSIWADGGYEGYNVSPVASSTNVIITGDSAFLGNLTFGCDEIRLFDVAFFDDSLVANRPFVVDITQHYNDTIVGGERFMFDYEEEDEEEEQEPNNQAMSIVSKRNDQWVKLYPNPFTGCIKAEFNLQEEETVGFELYNIAGVKLYQSTNLLPSGISKFQLDFTQNLPKGVYFLKVKNQEENAFVYKLLKQDE